MAEIGSCISTKDVGGDKFFVMDCDADVVDSARTLDEAQSKADQLGCAIVIKVLRQCGGADMVEVMEARNGVESEEEYDYEED